MKRLILIITVLFMSAVAMAQGGTAGLNVENTFYQWTLSDADTVSGTSAATYALEINKQHPTTQDVLLTLDSIDAPAVSIQLKGKKFAENDYSNIGSAVEWAGTSEDTTITISNATANRYRYIGLTVTATSGKAQLTKLKEKIYLE